MPDVVIDSGEGTPSAPAAPVATIPSLDAATHIAMFARCLAIQGSWNYEQMLGNGIGFCVEPALRQLPGGLDGTAYRQALARQSAYFNAHPYLAGLAVGALARVEIDQVAPMRIERFRTALCGPLGAVGDRLVWASWLPACSLVALLFFGAGMSTVGVVTGFLILYNVGHFILRDWALRAGWRYGLRVATALGHPVLQHGPRYIGRAAAVVGGLALPLAAHRAIGGGAPLSATSIAVTVVTPLLAWLLVRTHGRVEGWRVVLLLLAAFALYSVVR